MNKLFIHSLTLIAAVFIAFLFPKSRLADYEIEIIAALFILFYIKKRFLPKIQGSYRGESRLLESVVFTLVILIVINTTGGVSSTYFFLIYFLLFSLSMILEPLISLIVSLSLVIFFVMDTAQYAGINHYITILSLVFLTPFAIFLGKEYLESEKFRMQSSKLRGDVLLFLSLPIKTQISNIKHAAENFSGQKELNEIKKSTKRAEELIDKFEKEI